MVQRPVNYHALTRRWVCPHGHVVSPSWGPARPDRREPELDDARLRTRVQWRLLPPAQFQANVDLLVWLGARFPSLVPYTVGGR